MFQFFLGGLLVLNGICYNDFKRFFVESKPLKILFIALPFVVFISLKAVWNNIRVLPNKKGFLVFCLFYLVHGIAVIYSENLRWAFVDLRVKLPMVLIPLFFLSFHKGAEKWESIVLLFFITATFMTSLVGTMHFVADPASGSKLISPFIHHINFSVFTAFSIFILIIHPFDSFAHFPWFRWTSRLVIFWLFVYLAFILKSLTGVVVLLSGILTMLMFSEFFRLGIRPLAARILALAIAFGTAFFIGYSIYSFYDVEPINLMALDEKTSRGNSYDHNITEPMLENGHLVFIYIADEELKEVWNTRSNLDYEGKDKRGHDLRYTLYRYMTSLGLRKDAEGFEALSDEDIQHVENGLTNYIYARKYSMYPRIYQTIWEYDLYRKTDGFSEKSFIQRLVSVRIGVHVARDNPIFGVGTGDVVDAYHAEYRKHYDLLELEVPEGRLITGANQWLNFVVAFGLAGFLIILLAFIYPAYIGGVFRNPLFVMFFLVSTVAMLGEETLRFQTGLGFFAFFYAFFVFLNPPYNQPEKTI